MYGTNMPDNIFYIISKLWSKWPLKICIKQLNIVTQILIHIIIPTEPLLLFSSSSELQVPEEPEHLAPMTIYTHTDTYQFSK